MAQQTYYAQVYKGIVNNVIAASKEFVDHYDDGLPGVWMLTDYYTIGNVHYNEQWQPDGQPPFRGNYAGIGYIYDDTNNVFYPPKPYKNAVLNTNTWLWEAPVATLPTITGVTPIINGVEVSYFPPTVPPEGGIVGYKYTAQNQLGEVIESLNINAHPIIITDLQGGDLYAINIGCTDTQGNTYWTVNPEEVVPLIAQPPAITGALPENNAAIITWATSPQQQEAVPLQEGAENTVYWKIGYKPFGSTGDYTWVDSTSQLETYELTGLTNGTKYAVVVTDIVNGVESEPSQPFYVTPSAT